MLPQIFRVQFFALHRVEAPFKVKYLAGKSRFVKRVFVNYRAVESR